MRLQFRQNGRVHRSNESDAADAVRIAILSGRRARIAVRNLHQRRNFARKRFDDLAAESTLPRDQRPCESSGMNSMNRISMPVLAPETRQRHHVRLHQVLDRDRVDLDRSEAQPLRGLQAIQHFIQIVAARNAEKALAVQSVQMDVQPPQPGIVQSLGMPRQQNAVGGERQIRRPGIALSLRINTGRSLRTSGSPPVIRNFVTPKDTATRTNTLDLLERQNLFARHVLHVVLWHAVEATDIAAIGDTDPKTVVDAVEGVDQRAGHSYLVIHCISAILGDCLLLYSGQGCNMFRLLCLPLLFIFCFLGLNASRASAALVCDTFASPPVVRGEGIAERVGDIRLTCAGGPPNALFTTTLFFFLNVNATNRLVSADSSALTGLVLTADNGSGPQPIAAPATLIGPSSVVFGGFGFRLSSTGSVTLQLAGLRAAANELMFATNSSIQVTLASNPNTLLSVPSTQLIVGTPEHGLYSAFSSKIVCGTRGSPLAVNPDSFTSFLVSGSTFNSTRLTEGFPDAFGPLSAWQNLNADTGTRIIVNYSGLPAGARLFVPSVIAGSDAVRPTAAGDLGLTASGGQYAPGSSGSLLLSLVQFNDSNGAHGSPIYKPGAPGSGTVTFDAMSEVALYNGAGAAVYEVMDANPSLQESAQFPTFLSLPSFSGSAIETSETVSLAPLSTVETATVKDPLPRFEQVDVPPDCSIVGDCGAHYFPRLYVVESALNYSIPAGSSYQVNYIQVQNMSGGVMQWATSLKYLNGGSWLTVSPASGVGNSTIRLDATPGSLAPGTYNAILTIDAGPIGARATCRSRWSLPRLRLRRRFRRLRCRAS